MFNSLGIETVLKEMRCFLGLSPFGYELTNREVLLCILWMLFSILLVGLLMRRLFFLILVFSCGSVEVAANDRQDESSQTQFFIEQDRNKSLTALNLILDNQDSSIIKTLSVSRVSKYAECYRQTVLFLSLKIDGSDVIRGPPLS